MGPADPTLILLVIVFTFAVTVLAIAQSGRAARNGRVPPVRALSAAAAVAPFIGAAIEADRPVHVSFGAAGVGGPTTPLALAAAGAAYHIAGRAAVGTQPVLLTMSESEALSLGLGTLRRAYRERGRFDRFSRTQVRWLPAADRALVFAAGLSVWSSAPPGAVVLNGRFGVETALILEAARRRGAGTIVGSDQLEGQAVAYALADHALLGGDPFVLGAYLDPAPGGNAIGTLLATDTLRLVLILGLLAACALALREPLAAALAAATAGGG
jgi:hypothetical protein